MEHIAIRTPSGETVEMRVEPTFGARLELGQSVLLVLGEGGRPESIGDQPARFLSSCRPVGAGLVR